MNDDARRDAYRRQTGRRDLTPGQRRRANHKQRRQLAHVREVRTGQAAQDTTKDGDV